MKSCPICRATPRFHYASNVTARQNAAVENRNNWTRYFFWSPGCPHAADFGKTQGLIADAEQKAVEDRWDAHAEAVFTEYTLRWDEPQRVSFRARIWPPPPSPIELFNRDKNEEPNFQ